MLSVAFLGDAWWPATLMLYLPRWPLVLPIAVLLPVALLTRRFVVAGLLIGVGGAGVGPHQGFNVPWPLLTGGRPEGATLRVVVFNAGGVAPRAELERFVGEVQPAVLVIPECPLLKGDPTQTLGGYAGRRSSGVCVFSRYPIRDFTVRDPADVWRLAGAGDISVATIEGPSGTFHVLALHLETVREGIEDLVHFRTPRGLVEVTALRRHESELAREFIRDVQGPLLVMGDLNFPVESRIYQDFWGGYRNAFSDCGWGYGHTKETRWLGLRIDHVLMDARWHCSAATIGRDLGSDHRPLIVDVALVP